MPQEVRDVAQRLLISKKPMFPKLIIAFGTLRHLHRHRHQMTCFVPDEDVPLKANGSLDILEVIKSAVHTFDKDTIEIGSSRSSYIRAVVMSIVDVHAASPYAMFIGNLGIANVESASYWVVRHLKHLRFIWGYRTCSYMDANILGID
ncbi:9202_t:CDS:2 [Funneliformis mosseae]|uniref:9202_t:CDS:1 n=1 Tax=Funneliformis mosseae TaxID=27381 RepID=A0A9N9GNC4_FUNMO|nr:9202_t:CDS:2 [Funneliformis mosseae]